VLAALGVLKVATADQMHRLMAPGHKDNKAFRNACLDLARHGLTVSEGSARDGNKLWNLTSLGLDAAAEVLGRPAGEMGGTARGAARSGALHAIAVNETVIAITRTLAVATRPVLRQTTAAAAPRATSVMPASGAVTEEQGLGWIGSWSTEVSLSTSAGRGNRAGVRADVVLQAPEAGVPVLFVEVDNCTESADTLAAKFEKYLRYFRAKTKNSLGGEMPAWRSRYRPSDREGHPPVAIVFNPGSRTGVQALRNRMRTVLEQTRPLWAGDYHAGRGHGAQERDGFYDYADAIPVLFTTLDRLQADGPRRPVWWRCGHRQWESLPDALANPADHTAWHARDEQRRLRNREAEEARRQEQEAEAERWSQERGLVADPVPVRACEQCGGSNSPLGEDPEPAPPKDGQHCPACRAHLIPHPYPTLRETLFGRRQRNR
jgi:hypothetical protein